MILHVYLSCVCMCVCAVLFAQAEGVKDTQAREVAKRTFVPSLLTFEEDVMARKKAEYAAETTPPVVPVQKPRSWWKWW